MQAPWSVHVVSPAGTTPQVTVHCRDALVAAARVLRHPSCDPARLVWAPEVEPSGDGSTCGHLADICNSPWCVVCSSDQQCLCRPAFIDVAVGIMQCWPGTKG